VRVTCFVPICGRIRCVCVCVGVGREGGREGDREREREGVCEMGKVYVRVTLAGLSSSCV